MLSVLASKGLVLGVLFLMTFSLGIIPVKLMSIVQRQAAESTEDGSSERRGGRKLSTYKRVLSFLSCFAAGVFLATCFLDLLPEVRKKLTIVLFDLNILSGFPLAEFIMSWGLFFILVIEQIVLSVKESHLQHSVVGEKRSLLGKPPSPPVSSSRSRTQCDDDSSDSELECSREHAIAGISDQPDMSGGEEEPTFPVNVNRQRSYSSVSQNSHHGHSHDIHFQKHKSPVRAFILLMAISLHSVFEGLAVGLQSDADQVLGIFAALVLHKSILSFSIGMNLVQSKLSPRTCVSSIFFFSITSPIGVAIGILITDMFQSTASNLADGVLQGIACGTFLFMTFFEVMPSEFNSSHDRMLKLLSLLVGYSVVTSIVFLSDEVKAPFCKMFTNPP
jgi:zinc transporter 1/2/3